MATVREAYDENEIIRETTGVSGKYPCVGRPRIAVRLIVEAYRDTGSVERVHALYSQLTRGQAEAVLAYYRAHGVCRA